MDPSFKLLPEAVSIAQSTGKGDVLKALAKLFSDTYGLDREVVLESLHEREALGSTGFGRGVAIPHARVVELNRPVAAVLRLEDAIDFAAADGMPVDLVFGLLSPVNAGVGHLHALAAISRLVRDDPIHAAVCEAQSPEAIYALLTGVTDRDAA